MITPDLLKKFAPKAKTPEIHADALEAARRGSEIDTPRRLAHFMGQIYVETGGFTLVVESLRYRDPVHLDATFKKVVGIADAQALIARGEEAIANRVYSNRLGNGSEASGDGWRYRGSGYKQLTGRDNYRKYGALLGIDIEANPELAREPVSAARIAVAFWTVRGCSIPADRGDTEGVTRLINGPALAGLVERRNATIRALGIWGA